jgi:TPR repeat protein
MNRRCLLLAIVWIGCGDRKAREAQEQLDREIERAGGVVRDQEGRPHQAATGKYIDGRGGKVSNSERVEGVPITSMAQLPAAPPETDVTRGDRAEASGDASTAAKLYKQACADKLAGGCAHLALMQRQGGGSVKKDPKLAEQQLKQMCDAGDGFACYGLGFLYETTVLDHKHPADDVVALYDKGCTLKSTDACNALGMVYYSGRGGAPKDHDKAAAALRRGCELGDRQSCLQIDMVKR